MMRTIDAMIVVNILMAPIFLGSVFLLTELPIFYNIKLLTLQLAYLSMPSGLVFGLIAGIWYTKEQLKILEKNNEFKRNGFNKINIVILTGFAVFLFLFFIIIYFELQQLVGPGLFIFVVSGTFSLAIVRIILINSWQKKQRSIIMQDSKKFYTIPYPP